MLRCLNGALPSCLAGDCVLISSDIGKQNLRSVYSRGFYPPKSG